MSVFQTSLHLLEDPVVLVWRRCSCGETPCQCENFSLLKSQKFCGFVGGILSLDRLFVLVLVG